MSNPFVKVTPTITVSSGAAYTSGDSIGGLITLDNTAAVWGSILNRIVVTDSDNQKAAFTLYLFDAAPTTVADNAAWAPTYADLQQAITKVAVAAADYATVNSIAQAFITDVNDTIAGGLGATLWMILLTTSTPTYTGTAKLAITLHFVPQGRE